MPFCPNCGKEVSDEDLFCSKCGKALKERAELSMEEIDIPFPPGENPELEINIGVSGYLNVEPGEDKLIEGTIEYSVPAWKPEIIQTENRVTIKQHERLTQGIWDNPRNDWNVKLGTLKPYSLRFKTGISRGLLKLGSLPLRNLNLETGVSQSKIDFHEPNFVDMEKLRIQTGVGETNISGLLNARFYEMRLDAGVGQVNLDFTGEQPEKDSYIRLDGGIGGLDIRIKKGVSAIFEISGLSGVRATGSIYKKSGGFGDSVYATSEYDKGEKPVLSFRIGLGIGGISIIEV